MDSKQDFLTQLCCVNCNFVSENPLVTSCCNNVVCSDCQPVFQANSCQSCNARNYQILTNSFLSKLSSQVKVSCKHMCGYSDNIKMVKQHELTCEIKKFKCKHCEYTSSIDEFLCHILEKHNKEILIALSKEGNDNTNVAQYDPTKPKMNRNNNPSRPGSTTKYYCGKDIGFRCGCCSGCGPTNGDNCLACMILDVKTRNLPKGYLVNKYGATAILSSNNVFSCGRMLSSRQRCGENSFWCDGCDSLTRNRNNYGEAFQK